MSWFRWILVAIFIVEMAGTAFRVGKPRDPLTGADACSVIVIDAILMLGIIFQWGCR